MGSKLVAKRYRWLEDRHKSYCLLWGRIVTFMYVQITRSNNVQPDQLPLCSLSALASSQFSSISVNREPRIRFPRNAMLNNGTPCCGQDPSRSNGFYFPTQDWIFFLKDDDWPRETLCVRSTSCFVSMQIKEKMSVCFWPTFSSMITFFLSLFSPDFMPNKWTLIYDYPMD